MSQMQPMHEPRAARGETAHVDAPRWVRARCFARRVARRQAPWCVAALLLAVGCDGPGVVSPGRVRIATTGGVSASQAIVGTWRRTVYFVDDFGFSRSTETSWQFGADGTAARAQIARNYTVGLVDVLVSAGRYRVEGTRVVIDLVSPTPTQLAYEVRRTGNELELAGQVYVLVGG